MHFIDVGQGDSILIQLPNGRAILVDGGSRRQGKVVADYLASHGVDDLDMVVSTSPDADHLGGLVYLLENFNVKQAVDSGQSQRTKTYADYRAIVARLNLSVRHARSGQSLSLDSAVSIMVLSPPDPAFKGTRSDTNANSVVLLFKYNNTEILLTGDAEAVTEDYLLLNPVDIDVLKVAHHGSKYSSTWRFLSAFSPEVGVISAGCDNPYGHPHNETTDRLTMLGVKIFTTCRDGNIALTTNGISYAFITEGEPVTVGGKASNNTSVRVEICRVIYDPPGPEPDNERITLCNNGDASIDIGGWMLSDGEGNYTLSAGTILKAHGRWSVTGATYNPPGDPKGLFLNNKHDEVLVFNPQGELMDIYAW